MLELRALIVNHKGMAFSFTKQVFVRKVDKLHLALLETIR
jgi:hypothetical protein